MGMRAGLPRRNDRLVGGIERHLEITRLEFQLGPANQIRSQRRTRVRRQIMMKPRPVSRIRGPPPSNECSGSIGIAARDHSVRPLRAAAPPDLPFPVETVGRSSATRLLAGAARLAAI